MKKHQMLIGGKRVEPASGTWFESINPFTAAAWALVPRGGKDDVDQAVAAAKKAFYGDDWRKLTATARGELLRRLADLIAADAEKLAEIESTDNGKLIAEMRGQLNYIPQWFRYFGGLADKIEGRVIPIDKPGVFNFTREEPLGVVAAITPWNSPLLLASWKLAPALAAGNTVVWKPSEYSSVSALSFGELFERAGFPPGVVNIVTGYGPVVGEAIASHPMVDMVSFTGSVRAGKRVGALAGEGIRKVTLELGGKSAFVVLDDAPFDKAIPAGARNAMLNSGQTCSAWTRMVVPRSRYQEALDLAAQAIGSLKVGDPMDPGTRLGPLISDTQRQRVEGYIAKGKQEGARVVVGGRRPAGFGKGYYVEPTIFADVQSKMTIAQEEIFGPVLSVLPYDTEEEAIRIANDTIYGLAGGVWSGDADRAMRVARRIRTGQVDVNGGRYNPLAPFGGYKQSGIGRELGMFGLEEYFQIKSIAR